MWRAYPWILALRTLEGKTLADGDLTQVARGDRSGARGIPLKKRIRLMNDCLFSKERPSVC